MNDDQQSLFLEQEGIIFATGSVDDSLYTHVLVQILNMRQKHPKRPLVLYITGNGGDTSTAWALVDIIQADGNIWGVGLGRMASCSGYIWAACAQRYAGRHMLLGLHHIYFDGEAQKHSASFDLEASALELQEQNRMVAALYAEASNHDTEYWYKEQTRSVGAMNIIHAGKLINLQLAKPLTSLKDDLAPFIQPPAHIFV